MTNIDLLEKELEVFNRKVFNQDLIRILESQKNLNEREIEDIFYGAITSFPLDYQADYPRFNCTEPLEEVFPFEFYSKEQEMFKIFLENYTCNWLMYKDMFDKLNKSQ